MQRFITQLVVLSTITCLIFGLVMGKETAMNGQDDMPTRYKHYAGLATVIERLPVWADRDFTETEWQKYLEVAAILQQVDAESMQRVMLLYLDRAWREHGSAAPAISFTQPMILMRIMFDVPETLLTEETRGVVQARGVSIMGNVGWYLPFDKDVDRRTISVAHPLMFTKDGPSLIGALQTGFPGSRPDGPHYEMHQEYRAFSEMYEMRDLSTFTDKPTLNWKQLAGRGRRSEMK